MERLSAKDLALFEGLSESESQRFSLISFLSQKKQGINQIYALKPLGCMILFATGTVILSGFYGNQPLIVFATMGVSIVTVGPIYTSSKAVQP